VDPEAVESPIQREIRVTEQFIIVMGSDRSANRPVNFRDVIITVSSLRLRAANAGSLAGKIGERIMVHIEHHRTHRTGWLRASVLGANDGIVSTASLLLGVAAAHATHSGILVAGVAGLVGGAMAMAAGEYVSVSSQADTEQADLAIESEGLETDERSEREELAMIYVQRGLEAGLAKEVAKQLMAFDALGAHARDELGISENLMARPLQAALASGASFTVGAAIPLLTAVLVTNTTLIAPGIAGVSLILLALLGGLAAQVGGARVAVGAIRVLLWGALAMGLTAGIGSLF
jgi:VIT1/CCC1 family predicted Fe2+/Mn2+ transporter